MKWIKLNTQVKLYTPITTRNYYAPLTSRVDTLEKANSIIKQQQQQQQQHLCSLTDSYKTVNLRCKANPPSDVNQGQKVAQRKKVHFSLPANHTDKNSTVWRKKWETPTSKLRRRLLKAKLRSEVLDGSIPLQPAIQERQQAL